MHKIIICIAIFMIFFNFIGFTQNPGTYSSKCSEDKMGVSRNIILNIGEVDALNVNKTTDNSFAVDIPESYIGMKSMTIDGVIFGNESKFILHFDDSITGNFIVTTLMDKDNNPVLEKNLSKDNFKVAFTKEIDGQKVEYANIGGFHYRIKSDILSSCQFKKVK